MKKFSFLAFLLLLFSFSNILLSQQKPNPNSTGNYLIRCNTDKAMERLFAQDPAAQARFQSYQKSFEDQLNQVLSNPQYRLNAVVTIPVVVHIGLPNPNLVTDATVLNQLDTLNWSYGDAPSTDSLRVYTPFRTSYGRSNIRFCLAQRTPGGAATNGIDRVVNNTTFDGTHPSTQIPAWDPTKYLNIWVVRLSGGVLGYSYLPGSFAPSDPRNGFVNDYRAFGSGPSTSQGGYLYNDYNGGKTAVHELGHFFNLEHPWGSGDSNPSCIGTDNCADTPPTNGPTFNCASGPVLNSCSPTSPGVMWQNYMDYPYDRCLLLFTLCQATRMNTALTSPDRSGLTTSDGCTPPGLPLDNAGISDIITPLPGFATCDVTIPLTATLFNYGSNALTSATITVKNNGVTVQTYNWTGNLASYSAVDVPLNPVSIVTGANAIQVCTSLPNGNVDSDPLNDCKTVNGSQGSGTPLPLIEGFEGATFPPSGWSRANPDNGITWQRNTIGLMHGGTADAFVNHFNYMTDGAMDDLLTPLYSIGTADSLWVSFWGAYKGFPGIPYEEFQVAVSSDCGGSFTTVYSVRNDTAFAIQPISTNINWTTSSVNEWIKRSIDLSSFIPNGNVQVRFRAINHYGNNFFLDDINLDKKIFPNNDAGIITISKPDQRLCTNSQAPVVSIKNFGKLPLTSVKINYQIDAAGPVTTFSWTGNLLRNQTASVTLPVANFGTTGSHSIKVYTSEPNNVTDGDLTNDSLTKAVTTYQIFPLSGSITEEFTGTAFPPSDWSVFNPNNDLTWQRNASVGRKNPGSAWFNDFINTTVDRYDDLFMPNYSYSGIDSIFLTFSVAHITRTYPGTTGSRLDTLQVLVSRDCGNSFTTVYKKYGEELQTVNDPNFPNSFTSFVPNSNQWRRDSVNLGKWLGTDESLFVVAFRFSGNIENNLYLDDVNLRTQVLPVKLKNQGYLVLPNPFTSTFGVWHYQIPTTLRYINVYNSVGQLVWSKRYPGGGEKYIQIDLGGRASGIYTVNIGYEDSNRNINVQVVKY